jgi:hypothetical protein
MPHSLRRLRISTVAIAAPCVEPGYAAIPTPFLVALVFWLAILFAGFGLLSSTTEPSLRRFSSARYRSPALFS